MKKKATEDGSMAVPEFFPRCFSVNRKAKMVRQSVSQFPAFPTVSGLSRSLENRGLYTKVQRLPLEKSCRYFWKSVIFFP